MAVVLDFILPWTQEVATAGQTVFSTTWTADVASDVVVYARTAAQDPDDATQLVSTNDYNVAFIGVDQIVEVTFLAGRTLGDIITITRDTPADRLNLFINTNFTPSMLNGQFGRLVMMIQQNDLYNLDFAPHYNISATPTAPDRLADIILPILPALKGWRKNAANTAIEAVDTVTIPVGVLNPFTDDNRMVRTKIAGPENTIEQIDVEITDANVIQSTAGDLGLDAAGNLKFKGIAFPNAGAAPGRFLSLIDATHMQWVDFSGIFAFINLSNLAATAVNVDLNPGADGTIDLGAPTFRWADFYALTANTGEALGNTFKLRAFDTNAMAYVDFITLTAGNPPTAQLASSVTGVTQLAGTNDTTLATTEFVTTAIDNAISGFDFKDPVYAGTTAALNTTYNNGVAGVGATLTANVNGAFATDTISPPVTSRILVKNQAAPAENGIYDLTDAGSAGTPYILTRSADYDTIAEIGPGNFVLIENGATLGGSAWIETATVAVIGTDPITWSRFGQNITLPLSLAQGGTGASLVADNGGIVYSDAGALAILAHTVTANQVLLSGNAAAPSWSPYTLPASVTVNRLLWVSAANVISDLATANSGVLITSGAGVPSIGTALPNGITGTTQAANDNSTKIATTAYADNVAAGSAGWVLLSSQAVAGAANVLFNGYLSATYDNYIIMFEGFAPSTDATWMQALVGTGAGPTYQTTNYEGNTHSFANQTDYYFNDSGTTALDISYNNASFPAMSNTNQSANGMISIFGVNNANYKGITNRLTFKNRRSSTFGEGGCGGVWKGTTVLTSIKIQQNSGTITGTFKLYGVKN
jgi:hypothetical protein